MFYEFAIFQQCNGSHKKFKKKTGILMSICNMLDNYYVRGTGIKSFVFGLCVWCPLHFTIYHIVSEVDGATQTATTPQFWRYFGRKLERMVGRILMTASGIDEKAGKVKVAIFFMSLVLKLDAYTTPLIFLKMKQRIKRFLLRTFRTTGTWNHG